MRLDAYGDEAGPDSPAIQFADAAGIRVCRKRDTRIQSDRGLVMENIAQQAVVVAGVIAACLLGPATGIGALLLRRRRARARRRTPLVEALLRAPGHTLRRQLDDASIDLQWDVFALVAMPLLILAMFLAQAHLRGDLLAMMHLAPLYAAGALALVGFMVRKLWKTGRRLDNLRAGLDAELAVGQELDQLMRQGAAVFHDVPANDFNIDHVVVSAEGVFAVETKGFTKPRRGLGAADASVEFDGSVLRFPTWSARGALVQAERQAIWLAKWLTDALGTPIRVLPVLALPGWYVRRTGRGRVRVYSGKELAGLMKARGAQALSAQDVQRAAHQIEQRCRTVAPLLGEAERAA